MPRSAVVLVLLALAVATPVMAQDQTGAKPDVTRERWSVGPAANLALEGSGPWFAPGIRFGMPVGRRVSLDLESSAVFGGKLAAPYGSITSFLALNARVLRGTRASTGAGRAWIVGLRYTPIAWPPEKEEPHDDLALTLGHGWDQIFPSGWRVSAEAGISGGNGFLLFGTLVVALPLSR